MNDIIYCSQCKSNGTTNRCYITGYNSKCGHDNGWALGKNKNGSNIINCSCCSGINQCYITGYDYKCGHDNGWAYISNNPATCASCGKSLSGSWQMESNSNNKSYFSSTTGRYLGISDGYFLYGGSPNWVYSYCKPCWIKEIQKILPSLGLDSSNYQSQISNLNNKNSELQNIINNKNDEIKKLNKDIEEKNASLKSKEEEINNLKELKIKEEQQENLISAPVELNKNNFESIFNQNLNELEIEKIKNLLKSSEINEISDLEKLFSSDNIYSKTLEECKNACRAKLIETIKEVIEKISVNIEQKNSNINSVSLIYDEIKRKLNVKEIPENVSNESIIPLKNHIDELKKKLEKMNEIKEEINKIYLKLLE